LKEPHVTKIDELLERLKDATRDGRAHWTVASRADTFVWSGSEASVVLSTEDDDGHPPYIVRIVDAEGRTVEEERYSFAVDPIPRGAEILATLYDLARSDALDVTSTIKSLLDDLEG